MRYFLWIAVMGFMFLPLAGLAQDGKKTRNPFGVADVPNPDAQDVKDFVAQAKKQLKADNKDPNAAQWAKVATKGKRGSLDGEWNQRWDGGSAGAKPIAGKATIKTVGDRVYMLYEDRTNTYLVDLKREGNYLIGRYMNLGEPDDSTPWFGIIVDDERIDGIWTDGRWDSRRKLANLQAQADDDASFGDKFVCVYSNSYGDYIYLENAKVKKVAGRQFLCGIGADIPDQQWRKGRAVWIALDNIPVVTAFPTLDELRKAAANDQ